MSGQGPPTERFIEAEGEQVMYVLVAIVVLLGLWLGYAFVRGLIEGFAGQMRRNRRPRLKVVRSADVDDESPPNL
jgi:hypothetical protein